VSGRSVALTPATGPAFATACGGLVEAASVGLPVVGLTTRVGDQERGRGAFQELD
jgi:acetolactate synthase I/II/III large subunit